MDRGPLLSVSGDGAVPMTGIVSVEDKLVRFTRPGLTEEYSASVDGVRQDFVITERPAGAGELRVELGLSGARAEAAGYGAKLRLKGSGRELAYSRLRAVDATGKELGARLEVLSADRLAVRVEDGNATYPVRIDPTFSDADWVSLNPTGLPGANHTVWAIAVDGSGNVYCGGRFTVIGTVVANCIAKWDGSAWSALGSGMAGGSYYSYVNALAVSGTDLYAGGAFTTAGGVPANCIAKWDGSAWSALGSGVGGDVYALAVSGTKLYAGGYFTTAGGMPASNIAKWDGSAWSALGSGMAGGTDYTDVSALAVSGTDLYAGGAFATAGGVAATNIAKWDGSAWSALGSGMGGSYPSVSVLAVSGTTLYAGGSFTTAGGVAASNIAKWDGSAWSALGSGTRGGVSALAVNGTTLYAGGSIDTAGGVSVNYIAEWDGSAWSALGSGMNAMVLALAVRGANLYVGGGFTAAGGVLAQYIAQWDGSTWSAWGSGTDGGVGALVVSGTNLYAGGLFWKAGGVTANNVAKWDGSAWSALGSGMGASGFLTGSVFSLAADGLGHLFVGGYFFLAGTNVSPYIAQANIGSAGLLPPGGMIKSIRVGSGSVTLDCLGVPGSAYAVQRATDVQFTANLATLFTTNPPSPDGLFRYTDSAPPSPAGFYRLRRD